ncbi:MAG: hypothetical protein JJU01_04510 [Alkalibacterium sp.]|nr:hypothetical protein [Alkalibacterium sp.]
MRITLKTRRRAQHDDTNCTSKPTEYCLEQLAQIVVLMETFFHGYDV